MTTNTGSSLDQMYGSSERGHLNQAVSEWWNRLCLREWHGERPRCYYFHASARNLIFVKVNGPG